MVLHKHGDKLYNGVITTLTNQLQRVAQLVEVAQGLPFLQELKKRWDEHLKSTQLIRDILMVSFADVGTSAFIHLHARLLHRQGRACSLVMYK